MNNTEDVAKTSRSAESKEEGKGGEGGKRKTKSPAPGEADFKKGGRDD